MAIHVSIHVSVCRYLDKVSLHELSMSEPLYLPHYDWLAPHAELEWDVAEIEAQARTLARTQHARAHARTIA